MSDDTNIPGALLIYEDGQLHSEATCQQDLQVQLEAIEMLSAKGGKENAA